MAHNIPAVVPVESFEGCDFLIWDCIAGMLKRRGVFRQAIPEWVKTLWDLCDCALASGTPTEYPGIKEGTATCQCCCWLQSQGLAFDVELEGFGCRRCTARWHESCARIFAAKVGAADLDFESFVCPFCLATEA